MRATTCPHMVTVESVLIQEVANVSVVSETECTGNLVGTGSLLRAPGLTFSQETEGRRLSIGEGSTLENMVGVLRHIEANL